MIIDPKSWTPTSTPLGIAKAALQAAGVKPTKAALESATKAALEAVRQLTPEQLSALGEVEQQEAAVWVRTETGVLVIDAESVEFFPPDWFV